MSKKLDEKVAGMAESEQKLLKLRHTCEHVLHTTMQKLYPELKKAMGPATSDGFYFDFDLDEKVTEADFSKIEKEMNRIIKSGAIMKRREINEKEAKEVFACNFYKIEWVNEILGRGESLSVYQMILPNGKVIDEDLCSGPHLDSVLEIGAFKLLSIAGAYWHGDEKNKMLTRIYGTAFGSKEELDKYLWQQEEAKKRDHRKLGKELDLFHFQSEAPGIPFWHPKGLIIRNELLGFSRAIQADYGYKEVQTPIMMDVEIFKQSGHWDHYRNDMFFADYEKRTFALKPMNCPGMIQIYKSTPKSYRDLPLYLSEYGLISRKEKSGELNGMFRVMQATQDDAHLFIARDGIAEALHSLISLVNDIYGVFGLKFKAYLSTRPDDFMGEMETWNLAEETLKSAMSEAGLELLLKEKDGAFYGPKIDYQLEDSMDRTWQCATLQLDFQMPQTFGLEYVDKDGVTKKPVMIHRTIIGSFERFMGIITEHYAGVFPVWLSPVQVAVLPVSEKVIDYTKEISVVLKKAGVRYEVAEDAESLGKKIRNAESMKVPYMLIVGEKEAENGLVSVRERGQKDLGAMGLAAFVEKLRGEIEKKALPDGF